MLLGAWWAWRSHLPTAGLTTILPHEPDPPPVHENQGSPPQNHMEAIESVDERRSQEIRIDQLSPGPIRRFAMAGPLALRIPADFHSLVPSVTDPIARDVIRWVLMDNSEDDAVRNEAANLLRRSDDLLLPKLLSDILDHETEAERMRSFAAQHLGLILEEETNRHDFALDRLTEALGDWDLSVRREALQALVRHHEQNGLSAFNTAWDDPRWDQARDLLIRIAYDLDRRDLIGNVRAGLDSSDEVQQVAALYVLGAWGDVVSKPAMIHATNSSIRRVGSAASEALVALANSHRGNSPPVQP